MRSTLTFAAAAVALSAGSAAAQQSQSKCDLQSINEETGSYVQQLGPQQDQVRSLLRDMRDTAWELRNAGLDDACMAVREAITTTISSLEENPDKAEQMVQTRRDRDMQMRRSQQQASMQRQTGQQQTGQQQADQQQTGQQQTDQQQTRQQGRLNLAAAIQEQGGVEELIGTTIYSMQDEYVGEVEGLHVREDNRISHLIVSYGGFWDIGDTQVAIPTELLEWDQESEVLYSNLTEQDLEGAPAYDRESGTAQLDQNDQYFQQFMR